MRLVAVLAAAVLVATLLGCGGGEESADPARVAAVVATVEASDAVEELTDVEISEVEIDGDEATARVTGSDERDGELADFTVELVDDGGWKIDGFR